MDGLGQHGRLVNQGNAGIHIQDMRAGFYRPASAVRLRLALGADGLPTALRADMAGARIEDYSGVAGEPDRQGEARKGW